MGSAATERSGLRPDELVPIMRMSLAALAAFLTFGPLVAGAPAVAAERRMTGDELRDIARRELLWCEAYDATHDDCEVISLLRLRPDGSLSETSTLLLQAEPRLMVYIADSDEIEGDRLCGKVEASKTRFYFTLEGQAMSSEAAATLQALFRSQMAEFEGKTLCQAFFREEDPNVIREEITVDGERRTDLESTYRLHEGGAGLNLRPQLAPEDDSNRTTL
jgi:hypothetical protein